MKKKLLIFLLGIIFVLTSCNTTTNDKDIEYINVNNGAVFFFNEEPTSTYGLKSVSNFTKEDIDKVCFDYNLIIIDVSKHLSELSIEFLNELYALLEKNYNISIMFYKAESYRFLEESGFNIDKGTYENISLIKSFFNFYIFSGIKDSSYSSNIKDISVCIDYFSSQIKEYKSSL